MLICGCFLPVPAAGLKGLSESIAEIIRQNKYPSALAGVAVLDVEHDSVLVALNADSFYNPASVTKLLTGAAVLHYLGPFYTMTTPVYYDGALQRDSLRLKGNIYIKGSGDPGIV
ncbi:MAG: D-alanyl-D-alanine carboxypeptidase, partial [Chitinivibrionales bacterium]|nr:D-alanyl-D-alanine carboxypeptidase [Chitinivibrionales bacterium]